MDIGIAVPAGRHDYCPSLLLLLLLLQCSPPDDYTQLHSELLLVVGLIGAGRDEQR
jgi:hypothetical protein